MLSESQRTLRARIAAHTRASLYDGREVTQAGRDAFLRRFLDEQPDDLPEPERQRRAEAARRAHMLRLAFRSAKARAKRGAAA